MIEFSIYDDLLAGVKRKTNCIHLHFDNQGIIAESLGEDSIDHVFTLMEGMVESSKNGLNSGSCEELLVGDEEGETSVASIEGQLRKEMTVYEVYDANCSILDLLLNIQTNGSSGCLKLVCCGSDSNYFSYKYHRYSDSRLCSQGV